MRHRTHLLAVTVGLALTACGASDPSAGTSPDTAQPTVPATEATGGSPAPGEATDDPLDGAATDASAEAPADEAPSDPPATDPRATDPPATDPPATEATATGPEPVPVGGRTFATAVEPESQFDANPFPDLVVNDVGRGGEANLANILPSDRPVLLWTWAPH